MSMIGTFTKTTTGYSGVIRTLTMHVKAAFVVNDKKGNAKAPDFRIVGDGHEFGTAWRAKAKGEDGKAFLSVELDDPSFAAPLRAALFENGEEGKGALVWNRQGEK
jgi:uncharacterized protein (DUF736 family)